MENKFTFDEFNECLKNITEIANEAAKNDVEVSELVAGLNDIPDIANENATSFEEFQYEIDMKVGDIMDIIQEELDNEPEETPYYNVLTSIYDCLDEYYTIE